MNFGTNGTTAVCLLLPASTCCTTALFREYRSRQLHTRGTRCSLCILLCFAFSGGCFDHFPRACPLQLISPACPPPPSSVSPPDDQHCRRSANERSPHPAGETDGDRWHYTAVSCVSLFSAVILYIKKAGILVVATTLWRPGCGISTQIHIVRTYHVRTYTGTFFQPMFGGGRYHHFPLSRHALNTVVLPTHLLDSSTMLGIPAARAREEHSKNLC